MKNNQYKSDEKSDLKHRRFPLSSIHIAYVAITFIIKLEIMIFGTCALKYLSLSSV